MRKALEKLGPNTPERPLVFVMDAAKQLGLNHLVSQICVKRHQLLLKRALSKKPTGQEERDDMIDDILGALGWLRRSEDFYEMIKFSEKILEQFWRTPEPWNYVLHEFS